MNGRVPPDTKIHSFVYIVPVHNEAGTLASHVDRIFEHFASRVADVHVVLGVNGSRDRSADVASRLARERPAGELVAATTQLAGLGHGLALALEAAFAAAPVPDPRRFYLLTAADLPFGFTDLEAFERELALRPDLQVAVGSKAHPGSRVATTWGRAAATLGYRFARRALLGMKTADSQGSIFVRDPLARELLARTRSRDFFFSTEFVYHAEQMGVRVTELPVELQRQVRASTVRPLRDGLRMLRQCLALRGRASAP